MTNVPCGVMSGNSPMNTFSSLRALFLLEQERDMQRRAEGQALAQALEPVQFRFADLVAVKIEHALAVVTLDGKHLLEHGLQAQILALGRRHVGLQKLPYELVCNSMRFGGAMISLILPKLIRSMARDGIWTLSFGRRQRPAFCYH